MKYAFRDLQRHQCKNLKITWNHEQQLEGTTLTPWPASPAPGALAPAHPMKSKEVWIARGKSVTDQFSFFLLNLKYDESDTTPGCNFCGLPAPSFSAATQARVDEHIDL